MGSITDIEICPCCGRETLHTEYYYRSDEEYRFCTTCGYSYEREMKYDADGNVVCILKDRIMISDLRLVAVKSKNWDEIIAETPNWDKIIAETPVRSKTDFDVWNKHLADPKTFEEHFREFCRTITDKILKDPLKYVTEKDMECYKRGHFSDGSGDRYSTALWRGCSIRFVDDKYVPVMYFAGKIEWKNDCIEVYAPEYKEEEQKPYGVIVRGGSDGVRSCSSLLQEPPEDEINAILADPDVIEFRLFRNGEVVELK